MKKLLNFVGTILLLLSITFFVYGSMKSVEALEEEPVEIDLGEGLAMTTESQAEDFSDKAFTIAGVIFISGVLSLMFARGIKSNK